jgi:Cys-tRNA(Pro)/Cys-tRNA(Cys) deacylase
MAAGVPHEVVKFKHDPRDRAFGDQAVDALTRAKGIAAGQIFKTLVLSTPHGNAVAVLPVPAWLSAKAAAAALGVARAEMADRATAQKITGFVVGAISPFGHRTRLSTVIDSTALSWDRVYCSAGRPDPAHRRGYRADPGLTGGQGDVF